MPTDDEYRRALTAEEYEVLRCKHTEPAGTGEYCTFQPTNGHFACRACRQPLYSASAKFASTCGWPAFSKCYAGALRCEPDLEQFEAYGGRVEIVCSACDSHLGHVFFESGERTHLRERHCVNSLSIRHVEAGDAPKEEQSLRKQYDECSAQAPPIVLCARAPRTHMDVRARVRAALRQCTACY